MWTTETGGGQVLLISDDRPAAKANLVSNVVIFYTTSIPIFALRLFMEAIEQEGRP